MSGIKITEFFLMINVYYWAPCIDKVATIKAVINSASGFKKYFSKNIETTIINSIGEWNFHKNHKLNFHDLTPFNFFKNLPIKGFIQSRITYLIIILFSTIPLFKLLRKKKPNFLIIHLLTSLPIMLFLLFDFKTKLILRISGLPKLHFGRKILWKLIDKKIYKVTCPTIQTYENLKKMNIFKNEKLCVIYDPVIVLSEYKRQNNKTDLGSKKFIISAGRLTKQKNQELLIKFFEKISKKYDHLELLICGHGEKEQYLKNLVKKMRLDNKIKFLGHVENIKNLLRNSLCYISTSLWEDPGFVMIESAMCNTFIISSNCPNGPREFIKNDRRGLLFESNNLSSLVEKFDYFIDLPKEQIIKKKIEAKKKTKDYTIFSHTEKFSKIILST